MGTTSKRFRRVNVEISNVCNLQCSFCPEVERDKKVMSTADFRKTMVEIAPLTDEVCLHLMGEPTGHPQFGEMVDICSEFNVPINLSTNGMLIYGERREILLRPIFRQVNFSVHSFQANFPGKNATVYMQRLFKFADDAEATRPDLYVNYRLWDLGSEIAEDNTDIRVLISGHYGVDLNSIKLDLKRKKGHRLRGRVYVNFDSRFIWPALNLPERASKGTCQGLRNHIGIHADGTVVPCCLDKEAVLSLGNVREQKLQDILQMPKALSMKNGFERGELREELCRKCSFIERFD